MTKQHLMFDYETLGVNHLHKVTVLELSLFAFNHDRFLKDPYTFEEIIDTALTVKFDMRDQIKNYKTVRDQGAVDFWNAASEKEKKRTYFPSKDDLTLVSAIDKVSEYVRENRITYWWSRSNTFDPVILCGQYDTLDKLNEFKALFPYNKVRDTRSFIDGYFGIESDATDFIPVLSKAKEPEFLAKFEKHYSRHDIAADVLRLQLIHRNRNNMD